jgi:hypothetical protein
MKKSRFNGTVFMGLCIVTIMSIALSHVGNKDAVKDLRTSLISESVDANETCSDADLKNSDEICEKEKER